MEEIAYRLCWVAGYNRTNVELKYNTHTYDDEQTAAIIVLM